MKAKPYQISALKPQIQSQFQGALIFGSDLGIVQELSEKIRKIILQDTSSDINFIKISPQKIKEIPSILAMSLNLHWSVHLNLITSCCSAGSVFSSFAILRYSSKISWSSSWSGMSVASSIGRSWMFFLRK